LSRAEEASFIQGDVSYRGAQIIYFTFRLPLLRSRTITALGEVLSPKGRKFVDQSELASLPPGAPAGNPRSTRLHAISELRGVSRRFPSS